jgi:hypothetical protein
VLFETRHVATVVGLQLTDGREIVLKARPSAPRLLACAQVQHHLWLAGYACPRLLVGPVALGSFTVTAEAYVPGGEQLARSADAPRRSAEAPMIAGAAAAVFPASGIPLTDATLNQTDAFLVAYAHARGRPWSVEEWQVCWAAGVWVRAFNAKKAAVSHPNGPVVDQLRIEATERLHLAGA